MPTYEYRCTCGWSGDLVQSIELRDQAHCPSCTRTPERRVAAPLFRFAGRVTPGGGPDKFTADMLGIPLHDLPPALKADK
jgi:putative FmdB family regulatory protein